jgi:hypothetical protein
MRMILRLVHERPERVLCLGTVVADPDGHYWLCIQPTCDSVRIKSGTRRFPFVPLATDAATFHFVFEDQGSVVRVRLSRKPSEIEHWTFKPTAAIRAVIASGDPRCFVTTSGRAFRWVAQLNEGNAQRAAHELGVEQSRVGLAESDWLRQMSRSSS